MSRPLDYEAAALHGALWTPAVEAGSLWWEADPPTLTPDSGGISNWQSKTGASTDAWVNAFAAYQPDWNPTGFDGALVPSIEFAAGNSNDMAMTSGTTISQPFVVAVAARMTVNTNSAHILDGTGVGARVLIGQDSGNWIMYAGTSVLSGPAYNTSPHILVGIFNGASSSFIVDGTTVATGNAGSHTWTSQRLGIGVDLAQRITGHLHGIIVIPGSAQRLADLAGGYLAWQVRNPSLLAAGHPHRNSPPLIGM